MNIPDSVREAARACARGIHEAGQCANLGVFAAENGAVITSRAHLVHAVQEIAASCGLADPSLLPQYLAGLAAVPAWQVPIVFCIGARVSCGAFVPSRGQA